MAAFVAFICIVLFIFSFIGIVGESEKGNTGGVILGSLLALQSLTVIVYLFTCKSAGG